MAIPFSYVCLSRWKTLIIDNILSKYGDLLCHRIAVYKLTMIKWIISELSHRRTAMYQFMKHRPFQGSRQRTRTKRI